MGIGGFDSFVVLGLGFDDLESVLHVKIDRALIVDLYKNGERER